ncbi:MAG: hypothetical protein ACOCVF_01035 [bacterium]
MKRGKVDLRKCNRNDILISALGAKLKYVRPTTEREYLDHYVQYIEMPDGTKPKNQFDTRTDDGYVFKIKRRPEIDHNIVEIIPQ